MKSDSTLPSTASGSKKPIKSAAFNSVPPPLPPPPPITQMKSELVEKKSMSLDSTNSSQSTAHQTSATTPKILLQQQQKQQQKQKSRSKTSTTPGSSSGSTAVGPGGAVGGPVNGSSDNTAISDHNLLRALGLSNEPCVSPTDREILQKLQQQKEQKESRRRSYGSSTDTEYKYMDKLNDNLAKIRSDQSKYASWIRKLNRKRWLSILEMFFTGFTLLFYTAAFYVIFHVNATVELKMTPEFREKVQSWINKNNFDNCNHTSWIRTNNSLPPNIDVSQCFNKYDYGRVFFETYKSSTPNSSNACHMDRVEIHRCYAKRSKEDPLNIFWGDDNTRFDLFNCNGTDFDSKRRNFWAFNSPVIKYPMIYKNVIRGNLINRTVSSTAFFFQCPKCVLYSRAEPPEDDDDEKKNLWYQVLDVAPSIPLGAQPCSGVWRMKCNMDKNYLLKSTPKSFSYEVFPFEIVEDLEFCG